MIVFWEKFAKFKQILKILLKKILSFKIVFEGYKNVSKHFKKN